MFHPLSRRILMGLPSSERPPESRNLEVAYLLLDPAVSSSIESSNIMISVGGVLYSPMRPPVDPLIMLHLPSGRLSVVDHDYLMNWMDRSRFWPWETRLPKWYSTQVRVLHLFELALQKRAPLWRGQRLLLPSTLPSVSATGMPSHHWRMTSASSCDLCSHGLPLSTL